MLDWTKCTAVERHPEKVSGAWLFLGTRVPVKALFENLEDGATIDQFLEWFPGVGRRQVAKWRRFWILRRRVLMLSPWDEDCD
jgi:uncharacterized protein (DUF433 family)